MPFQNAETAKCLYQSLDPHSSEVRLLEVEPAADFGSPIKIRVQKASPIEKPTYIALSYVWGDTKVTREITANDEVLSVTVNLDMALRYIRMNWENISTASKFPNRQNSNYGPLWIDAICIDQSNLEERSQQVGLMREIYSDAHLVLSWLGESTPQLSLAISTFCLFERTPESV